tara:strand:+ start:110756 stop:111259 length:504 start_codon:yes stop_codon:yes gene_type:complete
MENPSPSIHADRVSIRRAVPADLPALYRQQLDADAVAMAVVYARDEQDFAAHWDKNFANPSVAAMVIELQVDGQLTVVGHVTRFWIADEGFVGYWVDKAHWGKGVASRALELLLEMVDERPLYARAASSNVGSIRVLEKCGFDLIRHEMSEDDGKYPVCEEAFMVLR